jgi:hypothetical protein
VLNLLATRVKFQLFELKSYLVTLSRLNGIRSTLPAAMRCLQLLAVLGPVLLVEGDNVVDLLAVDDARRRGLRQTTLDSQTLREQKTPRLNAERQRYSNRAEW